METDENGVAIRVRDGSAVVVGRVRIAVARQHHAETLALELIAHGARILQNEVLLDCSRRASRATVRAAMRRIENNRGTDMNDRRRSRRGRLLWCQGQRQRRRSCWLLRWLLLGRGRSL